MFKKSLDMIYIHDLNGNFLKANKIALNTLGYTQSQIKNMNISDFLDKKQLKKALATISEIIEKGNQSRYNIYKLKNGMGNDIYVETHGILLKNEKKPWGILGIAKNITERIKLEKDLLKNQKKLRNLKNRSKREIQSKKNLFKNAIETSIDGIAILGRDEKYIYLNQAYAEIFGYREPEELIGESWKILYQNVELKKFKTLIMPKLKKKGFWKGRTIGTKKGGKDFYQEISLTTLKNGNFICIVRDISNQMELEKSLKKKNEKLKIITENANDFIYILNEKLDFDYINEPVFQRKLGYSSQDLIGKPHTSTTHKKDIEPIRQKLKKSFKEKNLKTIQYETREFDVEGKIHWMEINGRPFVDKNGQSKLILIGRDITKRKIIEQKLREFEIRFKNILQNIREGYYEMDFEGNVKLFNRAFSNFIGYDPYSNSKLNLRSWLSNVERSFIDFIGSSPKFNFKRILSKGDEIKIEKLFKEVFFSETGKQNIELQIEKYDGTNIFIEMSLYLKKDGKGKKNGFFGFVRDITERKKSEILEEKFKEKLEKEVDLRTKRLKEVLEIQKRYLDEILKSSQFKSEFLATMSHELRTPLNAIIGFTDLLLEQAFGELNRRQIEYVHDIKDSSEDLLKMIRQILNISKIESGKIKLNLKIISVNNIISQVNTSIKNIYKEKDIKFKVKGLKSEIQLVVDPFKFKQIITNLLDNAYKFTKEGNIVLQIIENKDEFLFKIEDTGIGICEDDYPKVFSDFERASSAEKYSISGTGLGLSLSKRLVELHKGEIWFESKLGKGTKFYFTIPKRISPLERFVKRI